MYKMRMSTKRQKQIQKLMNIIAELKISLQKINKLDQAEERINKLKDTPFEIIRSVE